jgi:tetratricopeptide (TPR) repeat protein
VVLAAHYAEAGDDAKTFIYATRAGDLAENISAYAEARVHFTSALEALSHLPDTEQNRRARIDTTIKQINVAWGLDSAEQNLARLFQAEALAQTLPETDRLRLARLHYWIGRVYSYSNEHRKAASYYEQVLSAANEANDPELFGLASALGGRTFFLQGYFGKAVLLLEQAIPYLERTGSWQEWILVKVSLAISLAGQGHYRAGRTHGEEALQKALALNDRTLIASARGMTARVEFMAGDLTRMLDEVRLVEQEAKVANPLVLYMVLGFQAWAEGRLGMHERARATMAAARAIAARFGTRLIFDDWFAAAHAEIELYAGHAAQALGLAEQAVREANATGGIFSEGIAQRVWGEALVAASPSDESGAEVHLAKSLGLFEEGEAVIEAARTHVAWGKILHARGDAVAARDHFENAAAQFRAAQLERELEETNHLIAGLA